MIKEGSRVRYISEEISPEWLKGCYPPIGTLGTVKTVINNRCEVKWDEGTDGDGIWWCEIKNLEEAFKMKFNINEYKGKFAMHCKTREEARAFCDYLHSVGKTWCTGDSYLDYTFYEPDEAYSFNESKHANVSYYVTNHYTILEWSDFMYREFTKADLKTGDVIQRRNGDVEIVNRELEMLITKCGWNDLVTMREDLTSRISEEFDIIAVRRPKSKGDCQFDAVELGWGTLVYERKEPEEMTLAEVCRLLGKEIKIIK